MWSNLMVPLFFGIINIGAAHFLLSSNSSTPNLNSLSTSFFHTASFACSKEKCYTQLNNPYKTNSYLITHCNHWKHGRNHNNSASIRGVAAARTVLKSYCKSYQTMNKKGHRECVNQLIACSFWVQNEIAITWKLKNKFCWTS